MLPPGAVYAGSTISAIGIELSTKTMTEYFSKEIRLVSRRSCNDRASGSGNPRMEEYYYENTHETFYGRMMAIVRAGNEKGTAKLTVSAEGMDSVTVEIPVV